MKISVGGALRYPFMQADAAKQFTTIPLSHADAGFAAWRSEYEIK